MNQGSISIRDRVLFNVNYPKFCAAHPPIAVIPVGGGELFLGNIAAEA